MSQFLHHSFMSHALELAKRGHLTVSPNPMVGCVIVRDNTIVATGFHQRAGSAHAEVEALLAAGSQAKGATMYVTLEPCCHHGKTPPCTDAIIRAGIKQIYVACEDPNPLVSGKGIATLQQAGIDVEVGLMADEGKRLNEVFFYYMKHRTPFVIAKWAMSLDGKTITHEKDSRIISNSVSHEHTHQLRQQVDAIIVGANTILKDNPLLTVRLNHPLAESFKQPLRVVVTSRGELPLHLNIFDKNLPGSTLIVTTSAANKKWLQQVSEKNIAVWVAPSTSHKKVDLAALLVELGRREITSVLVEGGRQLHQQFFAEKLIDRFHVYVAPCIIGITEKKQILQKVECKALQGDYHFSGYMKEITHV